MIMVKLDKIYTRGGDTGLTSLGDGSRVPKHALRVGACGSIDEANAMIGIARLHTEGDVDAMLARIQNDLFDAGADICVPGNNRQKPSLRLTERQVARLEQEIDLKEHITNGTRTNKQGYQTQYVIYNGTAKSERLGPDEMGVNITKGSETLYIGEVWKAPEYNLIVVSMGIAVVSSQEINDQTGIDPVDNLIDNLIPNKPTDTRDTKNWDELYELIPEIVCLSTD